MKPQTSDFWIGAHGTYKVPEAISWLGRQANKAARVYVDGSDWRQFREFEKSPYYKIVEEWGKWRDQDEAKRQGQG